MIPDLTDLARGIADKVKPAEGTGRMKFLQGNNFEVNTDGHFMVTDRIIDSELNWAYQGKLKDMDRGADLAEIKKVMANLDTSFFTISKFKPSPGKFVYSSTWLDNGPWTAEQVNYIGVGMGFNYFDAFDHKLANAKMFVEAWNMSQYKHAATAGEHYWASVGFYWDTSGFMKPPKTVKPPAEPLQDRPPMP